MLESNEKRVLVAFSGGIDSCAAVEILREEGYNVEALTIDMLGNEELMSQARRSAQRLGVTLHTTDAKEIFKREIIDNFVAEYMEGRTPAPCTLCNTKIKWELLTQKADELGIYNIATGHYFSIVEHDGKLYIARAEDQQKDQSYYLWGVGQEILKRALTPMATRIKSVIKQASVLKKESMGICFLRGNHYTDFLCSECGMELPEGDIVDNKGNKIARHNGIARYTIGQKRGEGIPEGKRVVEINSDTNEIVVDDNKTLFTTQLDIENICCANKTELEKATELKVMVRGLGLNPEGYAQINFTSETTATIRLENNAWAIAPGQPIALYIGNRIVGGGYQTIK
ncbi:MAG: tRNA 2-thiouridine(34) synthase MnmA [Rikenellaceae bacterium]